MGLLGECLEVSETNKSPGMDFKQSLMAVDCEMDNNPQIATYDQSATPLHFMFYLYSFDIISKVRYYKIVLILL